MAPTAVTQEPQELQETIKKLASLNPIGHSNNKSAVITGFDPNWGEKLPETTKQRFTKYGIDISQYFPYSTKY